MTTPFKLSRADVDGCAQLIVSNRRNCACRSETPFSSIDQSIKLELLATRQAGFVTLAGRALSVYCGERSVCLCNL